MKTKLLLLATALLLSCETETFTPCECELVTYEDGIEIKRVPYEEGCEEAQYDWYIKSWYDHMQMKHFQVTYERFIECK
jgi:hypothetical protein